jgi:hypothetical protein
MQDREKLVEEMLEAYMAYPRPGHYGFQGAMSAALSIAEAAFARRDAEIRADEREHAAALVEWIAHPNSIVQDETGAFLVRCPNLAKNLASAIRAREPGLERSGP